MKNISVRFLHSLIRDKVARRLLPVHVVHDVNRNDRGGALHRAWGHVFSNQIGGAYYEFGVYRGESFRLAHKIYKSFSDELDGQLSSQEPWRREVWAKYVRWKHHFYAFDTFQGIPGNEEGSATFAAGNFLCSFEEFSRLCAQEGILEGEGVRYFAGAFSEVARREAKILAELQPAAIVNIDCDLYASARDALEIVAPKLLQGSVLLFDDWNVFAANCDAGERKAVQEFLEKHPEFSFEGWFPYQYVGQAFLVHRNQVK